MQFIYVPNIRVPKYIKQTLTDLKGEIDSSIVINGDFYTQISIIDRITRQKTSKEIKNLNNITNEMDLTDIYKIPHPTTAEYIFLKCTWNIL